MTWRFLLPGPAQSTPLWEGRGGEGRGGEGRGEIINSISTLESDCSFSFSATMLQR